MFQNALPNNTTGNSIPSNVIEKPPASVQFTPSTTFFPNAETIFVLSPMVSTIPTFSTVISNVNDLSPIKRELQHTQSVSKMRKKMLQSLRKKNLVDEESLKVLFKLRSSTKKNFCSGSI